MKTQYNLFPAALVAIVFLCAASENAFAKGDKAAEKAGAALFRDKGCAHCHGDGAVGTKKAPSLVLLCKDKKWTPAKITDQILNGGQKMPPFGEVVTDPEAAQLVAYVLAKHKPVPPPPAPGTPPPPIFSTK